MVKKIKDFVSWKIYNLKGMLNADKKKISHLKDSHKGEVCFIVGNGPSLTLEDLELIKDYDSFACNRIYKIYNNTEWRPKYYVSQDLGILDEVQKDLDIIMENSDIVFLNSSKKSLRHDKTCYFYLNGDYCNENVKFSDRCDKVIYEGCTVVYTCIQLAAYMGYSQIYIIGVDHSYNFTTDENNNVIDSDNNYMKGLEGKLCFAPRMDISTLAFRKAREYCDNNKVNVYNATRGGKLEEFIRVNLDEVVK